MKYEFLSEATQKLLEAKMILERSGESGAAMVALDITPLVGKVQRLEKYLEHRELFGAVQETTVGNGG